MGRPTPEAPCRGAGPSLYTHGQARARVRTHAPGPRRATSAGGRGAGSLASNSFAAALRLASRPPPALRK
eukprot:167809-Prymnesium_polylepis.1